jgi:hypothetical protein
MGMALSSFTTHEGLKQSPLVTRTRHVLDRYLSR